MAKKKKNSNYITAKKVAAAKEAAELARKRKKLSVIICAAVAVLLIVAIAVSLVAIGKKRGWKTDMTVTHHATIDVLGYGEIHLELYGNEAPITVANFVKLAEEGFYDGLTFHRIISGFMMQGGDPEADGSGDSGTDIFGEFEKNGFYNAIKHERGTISMARASDPNTASCQFFIVHKTSANNTASLDGKYAAFGKVTSGIEIVDLICGDANPGDDGAIAKDQQPVIMSITIHPAH